MPTRLDGERPGPNRNNLVGISKKGYLVILSGKLGDVICYHLFTVLKYLRKRMPSTSIVVLEFVFLSLAKVGMLASALCNLLRNTTPAERKTHIICLAK